MFISHKIMIENKLFSAAPNNLFQEKNKGMRNSVLNQVLEQVLVLIDECVIQFILIHPFDQRCKVLA